MCVYMSLKALTAKLHYESEILDLRLEVNEMRTSYVNRVKAARSVHKASTGLADPWPEDDDVSEVVQDEDVEEDVVETADDGVMLV